MDRYKVDGFTVNGNVYPVVDVHEKGSYYLVEDADKLISELRAKIAGWEEEWNSLNDENTDLNAEVKAQREEISKAHETIEAQRELMQEAITCVFVVCPDLHDRLRKAIAGGE